MQEFSLSSQEGVALMCLAEALLRIPDAATRDALIRDKVGARDWRSHVGHSPSLFVNAATWGLVVTGKLTATSSEADWDDVAAVFGDRGPGSRCWCQRYKLFPGESFAALGPDVLAILDLEVESETVELLAEITLAFVLFTDASTVDLAGLRRDAGLVGRLLGVGLLLTIAVGGVIAQLVFPELPLATALLIGAILAPTDAALGLPVVANPAVPTRVRRILNVESGLNDGIATPFVLLFIALATRNFRPSELTVGAVAHAPAVTCSPRDDVHQAMGKMKTYRVRRLPVVDQDGAPSPRAAQPSGVQ